MQGTAKNYLSEKISRNTYIDYNLACDIDWDLYIINGVRNLLVVFHGHDGSTVNVLSFQHFLDVYAAFQATWPVSHSTADVVAYHPERGYEIVAAWDTYDPKNLFAIYDVPEDHAPEDQ